MRNWNDPDWKRLLAKDGQWFSIGVGDQKPDDRCSLLDADSYPLIKCYTMDDAREILAKAGLNAPVTIQ